MDIHPSLSEIPLFPTSRPATMLLSCQGKGQVRRCLIPAESLPCTGLDPAPPVCIHEQNRPFRSSHELRTRRPLPHEHCLKKWAARQSSPYTTITAPESNPFRLLFQNIVVKYTIAPAKTTDTMVISLIRIFKAGPAVSLKGSPTVSPVTAALCESDFLPP